MVPKSTLHQHFLIGLANSGGKPRVWTRTVDFLSNSRGFALKLSSRHLAVAVCDLRCPSVGRRCEQAGSSSKKGLLTGICLGYPIWTHTLLVCGFFTVCLCACARAQHMQIYNLKTGTKLRTYVHQQRPSWQ